MSRHLEPAAQVIPDSDPELSARLAKPQQSIAAITSEIASCPGADFAARDLTSDIALRAVGVQRNFRPVEHHQQLGLVGVKSRQKPVQGDETGAAEKDEIQTGGQRLVTARSGSQLVGFQIGVKVPDQAANLGLGGTALIGESAQLRSEEHTS